jgi:hypothetical protein
MKHNWFTSILVAGSATLALSQDANSATVKHHPDNDGFKVVTKVTLGNSKTTDLHLLQGQGGRQFLYLASADGKLSIFDVTNLKELRKLNSWTMSDGADQTFHFQAINDRFAVASDSKTDNNLTVLDLSNTPSEEIARRFKDVDAYAIDGDKQIVYVAQRGALVIIRFDRPITREAEIWEQSYEAR